MGKPQALKKAFRNPLSYYANGKVVGVNYIIIYYYYLRNTQGNVVKLVDKNGNTVVSYTYDSWGKPLSTTGSSASTLGADQPFRYRGYIYDNETGFYYLQSRYYDPNTCRFISADIYLSTGQGILGHNAYAYCGNNPVARMDSEGKFFFTAIGVAIGGIIGGITGAIVGGISAAISGEDITDGIKSGAMTGLTSGAITGAGAGIIADASLTGGAAIAVVVTAGVFAGVTSETVDSLITGEKKDAIDYIGSALLGGATNLLCFGVSGGASGAMHAKDTFVSMVKSTSKHIIRKAKKNFISSTFEDFSVGLITEVSSWIFGEQFNRFWHCISTK